MATNPNGPAVKTSVSMPSGILRNAQREARVREMTFSAYVRGLVIADLGWETRAEFPQRPTRKKKCPQCGFLFIVRDPDRQFDTLIPCPECVLKPGDRVSVLGPAPEPDEEVDP